MKLLDNIRNKKLAILFWTVVVILFVCASFLSYADSPLGSSKALCTVDIPKGTRFQKIVEILDEADLVKYKSLFYLLAFFQHAAGHIRAGEYEFSKSMTPLEIIRKLVRGEIKGYSITFPEDFTVREMAVRLASYKLVDEEAFMKLTNDREFLKSIDIEGESLEGFLFPDTYRFDRSMSKEDIIRTMVHRFREKVRPEMLNRAKELGFSLREFVTMASIIGKESGNEEEKPLISAVFYNRLKKGMKLQSDPTAVYDLNNFKGIIKKSHLQNNTAHNTYHINGLPPGPIANPGLDSLMAALYPASVNYLYFVAKNDGSHHFSSNLTAHNEAVSRYRNKEEKI